MKAKKTKGGAQTKGDAQIYNKLEGLTDERPTRLFSRLVTWGGLAVVLAGAAVVTARTEAGTQRLAQLFEPAAAPMPVQRAEAPKPAADPMMLYETRRLADAVRALAAERDALAERVAAIERNASQSDITASIPQRDAAPAALTAPAVVTAPVAAAPAAPAHAHGTVPPTTPTLTSTPAPLPRPGIRQIERPMVEAALQPQAAPHVIPAPQIIPAQQAAPTQQAVPAAQPAPAPQQAALQAPPPAAQESTAFRTDFAVDVAGDQSMDGLRARWQQLRVQHGPLFEGLRPLVAVQEGARPGTVDLRLVAGPLANANAATRLCASLATAGVNCKPTVFDGQRLSVR